MAQFDRWAHKKIKAAQKRKAKMQGQTNSNLGRQFPKDTELSRMYDNDGNPIEREPRGYTPFGGH